jgi:hypothetical protein
MTRHIADRRTPSQGGRVRQFLRIDREVERTWHRPETPSGSRRLVEFLRIARGRTV